jgi:tRNA A-37 threonylcarbamoyl transferase component Bud32
VTNPASHLKSEGIKAVNHGNAASCSAQTLLHELAGFKKTCSADAPDISLERILSEVTDCRIIKKNIRRQVYSLQTPLGNYFLKIIILVRFKDRLRHFLLPFRKWTEWRNIHRLRAARIDVAQALIRGADQRQKPKKYFILTAKVDGTPFQPGCAADLKKVGEFLAYLHSRGIYHADLHPANIIIKPDHQPCLIDTQQVYRLPLIPRWLRIYNLGKIFTHLHRLPDNHSLLEQFLRSYNRGQKKPVSVSELIAAMSHHRRRRYRSRTKRCFKNSTDFVVIRQSKLRGFKRRDFVWEERDLRHALNEGQILKPNRVITFKNVCIKIHAKKNFFHQNRCRTSWKMSRALEIRGVLTPRSLGYFKLDGNYLFLSEFIANSTHLNEYLSSITSGCQKRRALKDLAVWLKQIHCKHVWQKDFKSTNVLCRQGRYYLLDLESVKIRRLSEKQKIVNLAQLNASLSNAVSAKDRLRFFYYYSAQDYPLRQKRREIYRQVWDITRTKTTRFYNLDPEKLIQNR